MRTPVRTFFAPSHRTRQEPTAKIRSTSRLKFIVRRVALRPAPRLALSWPRNRSSSYRSRVKAWTTVMAAMVSLMVLVIWLSLCLCSLVSLLRASPPGPIPIALLRVRHSGR